MRLGSRSPLLICSAREVIVFDYRAAPQTPPNLPCFFARLEKPLGLFRKGGFFVIAETIDQAVS